MNTSSIKNFDELPLFLNAQLVSRTLGVSPSSAYELLHEDGFPSLRSLISSDAPDHWLIL